MAIEIGALRALLSLDSAAFEKGSKQALASMNGLQRRLMKISRNMKKIGRTMATRVTAPLVAGVGLMLRSSLSTIDAQSKMAQSLGTSTRSMQVLARAADRAGLSTGEFEQIARQLTKRLSQAATGTGPAVKALARLGLEAEALGKLDLDAQILAVNKAIEEQVPAAERAAVAAQIFGDRAGLLASRLDAATIRAASSEIDRFGIAVTEVDADAIEEANDAISAIGLVTKGLANQITVALAPTLKSIAELIADLGTRFSALSPRMKKIIASAAALAAGIGPLALALGFMATGLAAIASPVGLVIVGLAALAGASAYVAANWGDLVKKYPALGKAFDAVKRAASFLWEVFKVQAKVAFEIVTGAAKALGALLRGDFKGAFDAVKAVAENLSTYFSSGFPADLRAAFAAIGQVFVDLKDRIIEHLAGIPGAIAEKARDIGRQIIQGIKEGISGEGETVGSAVRKTTRGAIKAAKDEAEIKSPSRVFERIGRDMMRGAVVGIEGEADTLAGRSAEAARSAAEAFTGASITSGADRLRGSIESISSAMAGAITSSQNMKQALGNVFRQIAADYLSSGISNLIGGLIGRIGGSALAPQSSARPPVKSWAGGGFTWKGARTGGLDGQGGRLAMLHPNETVIDHARGQTGGTVVHQQINVTTGVAQTVRAEIKALMPQIAEQAKAAVADGKRRGGTYGRAFA